VRADKTTLAGLSETLRHYLRGEHLTQIPVWRMIATDTAALQIRAEALRAQLVNAGVPVAVRPSVATIGGGSVPGAELPSVALTLHADAARARGLSLDALARSMRLGTPPVIPRVEHDAVWLDLRTIFSEDDDALVHAIAAIWQRTGSKV
jgi:L-seryl-tRNA(Ser) seleniumtransferase